MFDSQRVYGHKQLTQHCYLINRPPQASMENVCKGIMDKLPIDINHLKVFGCSNYMHRSYEDRFKLDSKLNKCVFVNYIKGVKKFQRKY